MSTPVIAIVGRPNVGKSTLFNALTGTRDALVADQPGVTRDRKYGLARLDDRRVLLVDTGGLADDPDELESLSAAQVHQAIAEADLVLFLIDARDGVTASDQALAEDLRRRDRPLLLVANKAESLEPDAIRAEAWNLGLGEPVLVAAAHRRGLSVLSERCLALLPEAQAESVENQPEGIRVAILGRPNVGKSTLVNRLLGEERVVASDRPGTTRDAIRIPLLRDGQAYVLIDTAGVRRRARVDDPVEKFSIIKSLQAVEEAEVAVVMLDASEGVTDQDLHLIDQCQSLGRGLVLAFNKWDGLDMDQKALVRQQADIKLGFCDYALRVNLSALHGSGLEELLRAVRRTHKALHQSLSTSQLTAVLEKAWTAHQPPARRGRVARLRYAHQGGNLPLRVVIHGKRVETVPEDYRRYLIRRFRKAFDLVGTPIRIVLREGDNPFAGRKNPLTPRQLEKKRRQARHHRQRGKKR